MAVLTQALTLTKLYHIILQTVPLRNIDQESNGALLDGVRDRLAVDGDRGAGRVKSCRRNHKNLSTAAAHDPSDDPVLFHRRAEAEVAALAAQLKTAQADPRALE